MQATNGNKRYTTFPTMINMNEKHIIDNRDKIPENSNELPN